MVSLLLQAIPPELKSEVVAARKTQVAQILFALYIKYQPGGQGEHQLDQVHHGHQGVGVPG